MYLRFAFLGPPLSTGAVTGPGADLPMSTDTIPGPGADLSMSTATVPGPGAELSMSTATVPGLGTDFPMLTDTVPGPGADLSMSTGTVPGLRTELPTSTGAVPGPDLPMSTGAVACPQRVPGPGADLPGAAARQVVHGGPAAGLRLVGGRDHVRGAGPGARDAAIRLAARAARASREGQVDPRVGAAVERGEEGNDGEHWTCTQ